MSRQFVCLLGLLVTVASTPVSAAPEPPATTTPIPPARLALANDLIGLTTPAPLLQEAIGMGWEAGIKQEAENFAKLDTIVPGLSKSIVDRGKVELTAMMVERLPRLRGDMAKLMAADATDDELQKMAEFYRSPTGQKVIRNMILSPAGIDAGDDAEFTSGEITKANRSAAADVVSKLSADETLDLLRFGLSPAGRAVQRVSPQRDQLMANWMTALMKDFEARVEPMVTELIEKALPAKAK